MSGLSNEGLKSMGISLFLLFNTVNGGLGLFVLLVEIILSSDLRGAHILESLVGLSFLSEFLFLMI